MKNRMPFHVSFSMSLVMDYLEYMSIGDAQYSACSVKVVDKR